MKAYALTWEGATVKKLTVATCPSIEDAQSVVDATKTGTPRTGIAVATAAGLEPLSGPTLAVLFNAIIDLTVEGDKDDHYVTRFKDREAGMRRTFDLLNTHFKDATEAAVPSTGNTSAAQSSNEEDMTTKGKKTKKAKAPKAPKEKKAPRVKKERIAGPKKARSYKTEVVSKGSDKRKAEALALIERANGATAPEIAEKLGVSLGTAKNLVWYMRRDGKKIVVDKTKDRRPYIIE